MCDLSGEYSDRNTRYLTSCMGSATRNTTGILAEGERNPEKRKNARGGSSPGVWNSAYPLFSPPETAGHTCSLSVRTCFIHQHFPFLLAVCPFAVPFPFARGKSPVFESVRGREARMGRCAGCWCRWAVESGCLGSPRHVGRKDTQTTGQIFDPLSLAQGRGALALKLWVSLQTLRLFA